jgi:hypothetical protein
MRLERSEAIDRDAVQLGGAGVGPQSMSTWHSYAFSSLSNYDDPFRRLSERDGNGRRGDRISLTNVVSGFFLVCPFWAIVGFILWLCFTI